VSVIGEARIVNRPSSRPACAAGRRAATVGAMAWDGDSYQQRFDELASQGCDVHGEAAFVLSLSPSPATVLDAGCGTGRVAIELNRRGVEVVGVDRAASMLAAARQRGPAVTWVEADLTALALGRVFDVVVMAGNVALFTPSGTEAALVAGCARHVAPGGALVAGFQLGRGYDLATYDERCRRAGLALESRWATWGRHRWPGDGDYAVSVHRRPGDLLE
jgi:SAM-dependent methyltransferase